MYAYMSGLGARLVCPQFPTRKQGADVSYRKQRILNVAPVPPARGACALFSLIRTVYQLSELTLKFTP
jgi:hypothetical protein